MRTFLLSLICASYIGSFSYGQQFNYGLIPTSINELATLPKAELPFGGSLPAKYDLSDRLPPPGEQGLQNSCVGWAVAYANRSFLDARDKGVRLDNNGKLNENEVFSPAFLYNLINNGRDGGAQFSAAFDIITNTGAVKWADMPYNPYDYKTRPNKDLLERAKENRISFYRQVNTADITSLKAQIHAEYPIIIGCKLGERFKNGGINYSNGDYIYESFNEPYGYHAMLVVGYDDSKSAFKVFNSYGSNWGNNGYCWIKYDLFPSVVNEGYIIYNGEFREVTTNNAVATNPISELTGDLKVINILHNQFDYNLGYVMYFEGLVDVPVTSPREVQVVIKIYHYINNQKGQPVGSLSQFFMMPDGSAAFGTGKYRLNGGSIPWNARFPYTALNLPRNMYRPVTYFLIAEPILYIDNFAVKAGQMIPFTVTF